MNAKQIILLVTPRMGELEAFCQMLASDGKAMLVPAVDSREALDAAVRVVPALAVIDDRLVDGSGLALVRQLLQINAFIFTAVMSDMDEVAFHEHSEGLGVLMRLPLIPNHADAQKLLSLLREMTPAF